MEVTRSKVIKIIEPTFATKAEWFLEDIIKSNLKSISPNLYEKVRNIIAQR